MMCDDAAKYSIGTDYKHATLQNKLYHIHPVYGNSCWKQLRGHQTITKWYMVLNNQWYRVKTGVSTF
jgi:hypothetical protein